MHKKIGLIIAFIAFWALHGLAAGKFVLVIDAGHGGKDPGALGKTSKEKDLNLQVALAFGNYVEKNCSDVKVVYTRKTDVFVELKERANIANKNKADLFISIHTNALDGGKISRGFETYTLGMHRAADNLNVAKRENSVIFIEKNYKQTYAGFDPNSAESYIMFEILQDKNMANSVELAKLIQSEVCSYSGRANKGVHQAGFLVLRETSMPSCLIEMGFITTPDEETFLNTKEGQDKIAKGIYNAFVKYKKKYGVKMAQNEDDHQTNQLETGDFEMNDLASNETGLLPANSDEEYNDNNENLPSNSIVEQDDNFYAVTEYAQPRAVRGVDAFYADTQPQDPVPLNISKETAQENTQQQTNPEKDIPITNPPGNLAANPQTTNAKEKQENLSDNTSLPATPNKNNDSLSSAEDKNVLAIHTPNLPPQTTDVASKAKLQKVISQENTKSSSNQKPGEPAVVAQTTSSGQKPSEPVVVAQTTEVGQKPAVVAQTVTPSQKPSEPVVVAQTTEVGQKPAVAAQTVTPSPKPSEPVVIAQTTEVDKKPAVAAQTTTPSPKPAEPSVVAQTTEVGQKSIEPAKAGQTDNNTPQLSTPQKAKVVEEEQQADVTHAKYPGLPEVTAPPPGTILEGKPIFKVQIAATTEPKNVNSDFFHGLKDVDAYTENGMVKYTIGATDNFAEVESLRNTLHDKFPGAFIIAFRDGYKIPLQNALREYRKKQ